MDEALNVIHLSRKGWIAKIIHDDLTVALGRKLSLVAP
jgi:hypothetical protein